MRARAVWITLLIVGVVLSSGVVAYYNRERLLAIYHQFAASEERTVRVGYLDVAAHLPLFVAIERDYFFPDIEIDRKRFNSSTEMMDALEAGRIDVGYELSADLVLRVHAESPDLLRVYQVGVSHAQSPIDSLVARTGSAIQKIGDLTKRTVGVFPGTTAEAMFKLFLRQKSGIQPEAWPNIRPIIALNQLQSLENGQVDALFTYEPLVTLAVHQGLGYELLRGPVESNGGLAIDPWIGGFGVMRRDFLTTKRRRARFFREAIYKAFNYLADEKNANSARQTILPKYVRALSKVDLSVLHKVRLTDHWKLPDIDRSVVARLTKLYQQEGVIPASPVPDLNQLFAHYDDFNE